MKRTLKYKNIITAFTLVVAIGLTLVGCSINSEKAQTEVEHHEEAGIVEFTQAQFDQAGIEIGKAQQRDIGSELKVNGIIDVPPHGHISISLPYGGFLKRTKMLSGTKVMKGQLLATIENPDFIHFQQEYQEGLAQREFLKAEYERQEGLYKEQVASGKNYQQAKSAFMSNEVRINALNEKLKLIGFDISQISVGKTTALVNIYSPVTGSIKEVYSNVGRYTNPQDVIMDLTDTEDLHVELSVYENDIPKIKEGQKIRFAVANSPNQTREAEVFLIGKNVREDRSVTVHGHLHSSEDDLLPGMYIAANIITGVSKVWAVPEEAVVRFQGKYFIYAYLGKEKEAGNVIRNFEMIEIVKGLSEDGYIQIDLMDKLDVEVDSLVLNGAFHILSKSKNSEQEGHGH